MRWDLGNGLVLHPGAIDNSPPELGWMCSDHQDLFRDRLPLAPNDASVIWQQPHHRISASEMASALPETLR
jgi:hypothetical protein